MKNLKKLSDEEIIVIVVNQEKEVYKEIVVRFQEKLFRYVYRITGDSEKAKDIVQDTFIKAFINLKGFNRKMKFSSWIYRIAHNETINKINREKRILKFDYEKEWQSEEDIEENMIRKEIIENTRKCLSMMSVIYSEPLTLFYLEEKSYIEISDILRMPKGTVATRIARGKLMLKKLCEKNK